jgi:hypothetical protein
MPIMGRSICDAKKVTGQQADDDRESRVAKALQAARLGKALYTLFRV